MKTKLTKLILAFVALFGFAAFTLTPTFAATDICSMPNVSDEIKAANGCNSGAADNFQSTLTNIINSIILILGIVAVIFIVIGGVNYMTSGGDAGKLKKAKDTILYACIGLVVCALAFAIANWAINIINNRGTTPTNNNTTSLLSKKSIAFLEGKL